MQGLSINARNSTLLVSIKLNKNDFFHFKGIPYKGMFHVISKKSKNRYFYYAFTHGGSTLVIIKKQKTLQLLLIIKNTPIKQTIKEKD